jgi:hypothetical protein
VQRRVEKLSQGRSFSRIGCGWGCVELSLDSPFFPRLFPPMPPKLSPSHFPDLNNNGSVASVHAPNVLVLRQGMSKRENVDPYTAKIMPDLLRALPIRSPMEPESMRHVIGGQWGVCPMAVPAIGLTLPWRVERPSRQVRLFQGEIPTLGNGSWVQKREKRLDSPLVCPHRRCPPRNRVGVSVCRQLSSAEGHGRFALTDDSVLLMW